MTEESESRCVSMPPLAAVQGMRLQPVISLENDRLVVSEALSLLRPQTNVEHFFQRLPASQTFALFLWQVRELISIGGTFTVNLPLAIFYDPTKVDRIVALDVGHCIILEIQDAERLPQLSVTLRRQLIEQLNRIQQAGYRIWLDDMPPTMVGQWSLSGVRFHGVKVSAAVWRRCCLREMPFRPLVKSLRLLGDLVVVEGIETGADLARCRCAGVDYVQGFLFPETVLATP